MLDNPLFVNPFNPQRRGRMTPEQIEHWKKISPFMMSMGQALPIKSAQLDGLVDMLKQAIPIIKQAMEWSDVGDIVGNLGGSIAGMALGNHFFGAEKFIPQMIGASVGGVGGGVLGRYTGEKFDPEKPYQPPPLTAQELEILRKHLHTTYPHLAQGNYKEGSVKQAGLTGTGTGLLNVGKGLLSKAPAAGSTLAKGIKLSGPALGEEAAHAAGQAATKSFGGKFMSNPIVQDIVAQKAMDWGGKAYDKITGGGAQAQPQGYAQGGYANVRYPAPFSSYGGGGGDNSVALSSAYNRYSQQQHPQFRFEPGQNFFQKNSELTGERKLAFQAGVEAFCKEANFDDEDKAALSSLMEKSAGTGAFGLPNWSPKTWKGNIGAGLGIDVGTNILSNNLPGGGLPDTSFNNPFSAGQNMGAEGMMSNVGNAMMTSGFGFIPGAISRVGAPIVGRGLDYLSSTGRYSGNWKGPQPDFKPGGGVDQKYQSMVTPQARAAMANYKPPIVAPGKKTAGWESAPFEEAENWWDVAKNTGLGGDNWSKVFNPLYHFSGQSTQDMHNKLFGPKAESPDAFKKRVSEHADKSIISGPGGTGELTNADKLRKVYTPDQIKGFGQADERRNASLKQMGLQFGSMALKDPNEQRKAIDRISATTPGITNKEFSKFLSDAGQYQLPAETAATPPTVKAPPPLAADPIGPPVDRAATMNKPIPSKNPGGSFGTQGAARPGSMGDDSMPGSLTKGISAPSATSTPGAPAGAPSVASTPGNTAPSEPLGLSAKYKRDHNGMDPNQVNAAAGAKSQADMAQLKKTQSNAGSKPNITPSAAPTPSSTPGGEFGNKPNDSISSLLKRPSEPTPGWEQAKGYEGKGIYTPPKVTSSPGTEASNFDSAVSNSESGSRAARANMISQQSKRDLAGAGSSNIKGMPGNDPIGLGASKFDKLMTGKG